MNGADIESNFLSFISCELKNQKSSGFIFFVDGNINPGHRGNSIWRPSQLCTCLLRSITTSKAKLQTSNRSLRLAVNVHLKVYIVQFKCEGHFTLRKTQRLFIVLFFVTDACGTLNKMAAFLCTHFIDQRIINPGNLMFFAFLSSFSFLLEGMLSIIVTKLTEPVHSTP